MTAVDRLAQLDDYLSCALADAEAETFEEELFAAAALDDSSDAALVDRIGQFGRYLRERVGLAMGSTRAFVDKLRSSNLKVAYQELGPPGRYEFPMPGSDAEIVVTRIDVDLRGSENVDLNIEAPDGTLLKTFRDIEYEPEDGRVYAVCEAALARLASMAHTRSRFIGTRAGKRQELAVYETVPLTAATRP